MAATSDTGGEAYQAEGGTFTDLYTTQDCGTEAFWYDGLPEAPLWPAAVPSGRLLLMLAEYDLGGGTL